MSEALMRRRTSRAAADHPTVPMLAFGARGIRDVRPGYGRMLMLCNGGTAAA